MSARQRLQQIREQLGERKYFRLARRALAEGGILTKEGLNWDVLAERMAKAA